MAGERMLYELRVRENLTLQEAAEQIGINKSTLCRYEQCMPENLRPEVLEKICSLYRVEPEIFRETQPETGPGWFRILTPAEVAEAYSRLGERGKLRITGTILQELKQ